VCRKAKGKKCSQISSCLPVAKLNVKIRGVLLSQCGLAIYIFLKFFYLEAKEELWKFKYFTMQKYNLQKKKKNPLKETKILQDIIICL
jgi:hypothetical protein